MMYKVSLKTLPQRYASHNHILWLKDTALLSEAVLRIRRVRIWMFYAVSMTSLGADHGSRLYRTPEHCWALWPSLAVHHKAEAAW